MKETRLADPVKRQPIFNVPPALLSVILLLVGIQVLRDALPSTTDADLLARLAFVPGRFSVLWDRGAVLGQFSALYTDDPVGLRTFQVARFFLGDGSIQFWTPLTYGLLHGGWTHVGLNAVWLLAFGAPVARRFGPARFLLFLALGAVAGAAAHLLVYPFDLQPLVGASASVSGCMGAALRFMFQPRRPVDGTVADAGGLGDTIRPTVPILALLADRRALSFLAVWFVTNLASGLGGMAMGVSDAPIAWQAHIGGFLFGLFAFPLFDRADARSGDDIVQPPEDEAERV